MGVTRRGMGDTGRGAVLVGVSARTTASPQDGQYRWSSVSAAAHAVQEVTVSGPFYRRRPAASGRRSPEEDQASRVAALAQRGEGLVHLLQAVGAGHQLVQLQLARAI